MGLNNIGLLVPTYGTLRQNGKGIHYLEDGYGTIVLLDTQADLHTAVDQVIALTGISSCRKAPSGSICRLLRVMP